MNPSNRVLNPLVRNWLWQSTQLAPRRLAFTSGCAMNSFRPQFLLLGQRNFAAQELVVAGIRRHQRALRTMPVRRPIAGELTSPYATSNSARYISSSRSSSTSSPRSCPISSGCWIGTRDLFFQRGHAAVPEEMPRTPHQVGEAHAVEVERLARHARQPALAVREGESLHVAGRARHRVVAGQARVVEQTSPQLDRFPGQRIVRGQLEAAEHERRGEILQRRRCPGSAAHDAAGKTSHAAAHSTPPLRGIAPCVLPSVVMHESRPEQRLDVFDALAVPFLEIDATPAAHRCRGRSR